MSHDSAADKAAAKAEEKADAKAAKESAKETDKTKQEGVYRVDQGESIPGPDTDEK